MIRGFRHRGLKRLYEQDDRSRIPAQDAEKIRRILLALSRAKGPEDMTFPGFRLHPPKGDMKGYWAVTVRANWRIVFRFEQGEPADVDYLDYH
ncbi:MAG: type II toxin-antitoxin system RelE/ParE family toxin [Candidatus Tectomicrobia bacterium]|uniref:Type II toxin-antitoxin system RelE/ParE family toxin n=1 Tax=Tectimicrobiota bacterium TaxID=2528274 RepID=A0A932ZUP1_UNCTE|nr:type II toxin-antitoxin system RelE/ParE family toxin [Candidatus Tectomicrobia bacterium]